MRLPAYPEYRESGVAWLGNVPAHWSVARLKRSIRNNDGGVWGEDPDGVDDTVVLRSTEQTVDGFWQIVEPALRKLSEKDKSSSSLLLGDLLITKSSGSSLHIGKTTLVSEKEASLRACYSNFMQRIRMCGNANPKFSWFTLNHTISRTQMNLLSNSTTGLANLNGKIIGDIISASPPAEEQTAIAAFLDRETGKIDALVAAQEKLLALLAEKRQATNSHAVTRGLNPDAPMKDSGIAWLGKVPAHWEVNPIKSVATINDNVLPESTNPSCHINYIDIGSVSLEGGICKIDTFQFADAPTRARRLVKQGDVIVSTFRTYLKAITSISSNFANFVVSTGFAVIRPTIDLQKEFAKFCLQSDYFIDEVICRSTGVSYPAITATDLGKLSLPFPSLEEQTAIATFLDQETNKIDALVAAQKKLSELLKERRSALIAAAVTGKIDVRNALSEEQAA